MPAGLDRGGALTQITGDSSVQYVVQIRDIADGQTQDLNLGQLLVGRERG